MKSPKPPKEKTEDLNFYEALKQILEGQSVTKREWDNRDINCLMSNGRLTIRRDNKFHDWILTDGDLYGEDFYVL